MYTLKVKTGRSKNAKWGYSQHTYETLESVTSRQEELERVGIKSVVVDNATKQEIVLK